MSWRRTSPQPQPPTTPPPTPKPPLPIPGGSNTIKQSQPTLEPEPGLEYAPGERFSLRARRATFDPFMRRFMTRVELVSEGKLSPKESLQRKLKKQRYKIAYVQDGKKVEVFATSIRGVRRVVYGKKQFRVYNTSGSDVTGYFKKLLNKESK